MANSKISKPKKHVSTKSEQATKNASSRDAKRHGLVKTTTESAASHRKRPAKDPEGGLTAEGRKMFVRREGSHLRPGVKGPTDTPEKMRRKGSFLRRHFANPRGPMQRDGKPTRLALSAHAWGEPVPRTMEDARRLAAKGKKLLELYQKTKGQAEKP